MAGQTWEVVGGADKGGILVRTGQELKSPEASKRLSFGALVEELVLKGERLQFRLLTGSGPDTGWVSLKVGGKPLLVKASGSKRVEGKTEFNPYALLGISPDATDAMIKSAFRKASVHVHPDRCPDDPEAAAKFQKLTEAKEFLLSPLKRLLYNIRHKLNKPTENTKWWSDWDAMFDEMDATLDDDAASLQSATPMPEHPLESSRTIDIMVMGATGMTGSLGCMLLHRLGATGPSWAIAGRDGRKLQRISEKFGAGQRFRGSTRVETADDFRSLARTARVVIDFTGPKVNIGTRMAEACVTSGTHYIEITGDSVYTRELRDKLDSKAKEAGVCIVAAMGYAAAAADFATWYVVKHLSDKYGLPTRRVDGYAHTVGSVLSGTNLLTVATRDNDKYKAEIEKGGGSFFLGGERPGGPRDIDIDGEEPVVDAYTGWWGTPGSSYDTHHVRCSCGLFDAVQPWGENFCFKSWSVSKDRKNVDAGKMQWEFFRRGYQKSVEAGRLQPPGSGPRERLRQETFSTFIFVAEADEAKQPPQKAHCIFSAGPGGAGDRYEGSASMCVEAAICLLGAADSEDGDRHTLRSGWGTPTFHLAHLGFIERLNSRGFRFKIVEGPPTREYFDNVFSNTMSIEE